MVQDELVFSIFEEELTGGEGALSRWMAITTLMVITVVITTLPVHLRKNSLVCTPKPLLGCGSLIFLVPILCGEAFLVSTGLYQVMFIWKLCQYPGFRLGMKWPSQREAA